MIDIILYILFVLFSVSACIFAALAGVYVGTKYNNLSGEDREQ